LVRPPRPTYTLWPACSTSPPSERPWLLDLGGDGPTPLAWSMPREWLSSPVPPPNKQSGGGYPVAMARARTVAGYAIPGIVVFFFWVVVAILAIILLAFIVHWAGGGVLNLRLGHFVLNVGFT
jgi:hypothetical protein